MPRLYCPEHGKENETDAASNAQRYRDEGESIVIVKGRLTSGPWLCDRCNARLSEGRRAVLVSAFPAWIVEQSYGYDFAYERRYFGMENDEVTDYGAEWPQGALSGRQRSDP